MKRLLSIVILIGLLAYCFPLFAATIYVPADVPTIQAGIDAALPGDTVLVADGIYRGTGNKNLDFKGKAITLESGNGPSKCTIDCEHDGRGFHFHSGEGGNSIVSGFTITNGRAEYAGGGILCESSSPTIINSAVIANWAGNVGGGICCVDSSSPGIYRCDISRNTVRGQVEFGGGGFYCEYQPQSSAILSNCKLSGNSGGSYRGGGIAVGFYGSLSVINCTISQNSAYSGGGIAAWAGKSLVSVTNSIILGNTPDDLEATANQSKVSYSIIGGGWPGEGNVDLNPDFVNPAAGNFRLKESSPCIGAGTSDGVPPTDLEGNPRPNPAASYPDMGAYENPLAIRTAPALDIFGMEVGNEYVYEGTSGGNPYTVERKVSMDSTTFPIPTYAYEIKENGVFSGKEYYQESSDQVLLWGASIQDEGTLYDLKLSNGLPVIRFPVIVGDHQYSSTTGVFTQFPTYTFNVSMDVLVVAQETVNLSFDTFEAYKVRYEMRVWGPNLDYTDAFFWWIVPFIGAIKDEDADSIVKLTSFAIGSGTISDQTDADRDGLKDYQELIKYKTDWLDADTDNDRFKDGEEVAQNTDPNDADSHPTRAMPWLLLLLEN